MNLRILSGISILLMIFWNYLANSGLIYEKTISEISDKWSTLFTPAGFTFGIWGVIYIGLTVFAIQLIGGLINTKQLSGNTLKFILFQSVYNALWIHTFLNEWMWLSTLFLLLLCLSNFIIVLNDHELKTGQKRLWQIYAGWTLVATFANVSIALVKIELPVDAEITYRIVCVAVALISGFMAVKINRFVFLFPVSWGLFGIAINNYDFPGLYYPAMFSAFFLFIFTLNRLIRGIKKEA